MSTIQLVAIDLDGTLLRPDHTISPGVAAAVAACGDRGVRVVLASGRSFHSVAPYAEALGLSGPMICLNGGELGELPGRRARVRAGLRREQLARVCDELERREIAHVVFGAGAVYARAGDPRGDDLRGYGEPPAVWLADLRAARDPIKVLAFLGPGPADEELAAALEPGVAQIRTGPPFLEWMAHEASKGAALRELAAAAGLGRDQIMAIGDSQNDLSMFGVAGLAVAMGDAAPEVRAAAGAVTASSLEDGVALALGRYVLGRPA